MGKIIIVSFAFMAFAFYELSGGDEFVPIAEEKRAALEAEKAKAESMLAEAKTEEITPEPAAQLILASASAVATQPAPAVAKNDEVIAAVTAALEVDKAEQVTQAPAVETAAVQEAEPEPAKDIREVTAARVNMRNGPGQNFNVLAKLTGGDAVEILQDPGDGWVKLRVVESGRVGWMADFLLTAANN